MNLKNYTPFSGMAWESWDCNGETFVTSLLRLKFKLVKTKKEREWKLQLIEEQGDLFGADEFYDEDKKENVKYESDYVPFKPCADLVVNATAKVPYKNELKSWTCSVALYDKNEVKLNSLSLEVKGAFRNGLRDATSKIPIRYVYAKNNNQYNPIEKESHYDNQIFYADGTSSNVPAGFGFIHRSWKSRLDLAGTYDKKWIRTQHPLPPHDFNYLHHQAAHPRLMVKNYIEAGSRIELENLIEEELSSYFVIPEFKLLSRIKTQTKSTMEVLMLDTLLIDLDEEDDYVVYASYRAYTPFNDEIEEVELMLIEDKE
jgi:hypothetical protein